MAVDAVVRRPGTAGRSGQRPLARKPKQLTTPPTLSLPSGKAGGGWVPRGRPAGGAAPGDGQVQMGDEDAAPASLPDDGAGVDPAVRAAARSIAARLAIPRRRIGRHEPIPRGRAATVPYRGRGDELDLDRSLELLVEHPAPRDEDLAVQEVVGVRRSVVLLVDVSGSMKGERIRTAAATIGAVAGELARAGERLSVVAFWSDAALLTPLAPVRDPLALVDALLRVAARGLTNVAFPLEVAAQQLSRAPARGARAILLSDCVHNAGPDPRPAAARLPRLDVLVDTTGEHDLELARDLAAMGRGRLRSARDHRGIAPALTDFFSR